MNFLRRLFSTWEDSVEAYRKYEYRGESIEYVKQLIIEGSKK